MKTRHLLAAVAALLGAHTLALAGALPPATQAKVDAMIQTITTWAAEPAVVEAVKAHNLNLPADQAALNQEKWRALTVLDPLVRSFTRNPAAQYLKAQKSEIVSEAFVSDAAGLKVAFIAKTSNWSHQGKPKHDVPMTGKAWQGPIEIDESSGTQQMQIAVPVLDDGKAIGSLVVGLSVTKLVE